MKAKKACKKKLTLEQKAAKKKRKAEWMMIVIRGKQKWVRRPAMIDGMEVERFIERNADDVWLLQAERYENLYAKEVERNREFNADKDRLLSARRDEELQ